MQRLVLLGGFLTLTSFFLFSLSRSPKSAIGEPHLNLSEKLQSSSQAITNHLAAPPPKLEPQSEAWSVLIQSLQSDIVKLDALKQQITQRYGPSEKISPVAKNMLADVVIQKRESKYRLVFEEWGLDAGTKGRILGIVRDRETQLTGLTIQFLEQKLKLEEMKIARQAVAEKAASQIRALLGHARYTEFALVESQFTHGLTPGQVY